MEYLSHLAEAQNSTWWNAIQPSEKWRAEAGGQAWTKAGKAGMRSEWIKKSPRLAGLNLFSWRKIEETGSMMLHRTTIVQ
jgi:hypothetical protein